MRAILVSAALSISLSITFSITILSGDARAQGNAAPIAVPLVGADTVAPALGSPYPTTINVEPAGGPGMIGPLSIRLHGVTHPCPDDLAVLLVHDNTEKYLLMSNAGGCRPMQGTEILFGPFDPTLPDNDPVSTPHGATLVIAPSNYGPPPVFPAPAPSGPYQNALPPPGVPMQGRWDLYVMDLHVGNRGVIAAGWSIEYSNYYGTVMSQAAPVAIPTLGAAASYPITFDFTGASPTTPITFLALFLDLTHPYLDDLRVVLESPSGEKVALMANAGGSASVSHRTIRFTEGNPSVIPDDGPLSPGTGTAEYKPGSVYETPIPSLPAPAPPAPYGTSFSTAFYGRSARGTWRLWVYDDSAPDGGSVGLSSMAVSTDLPAYPRISIVVPTDVPTYEARQPFIPIFAQIDNIIRTPAAVTWRNVVDGTFYASGSISHYALAGSTSAYVGAHVPLKKGTNVVTMRLISARGEIDEDIVTIAVNEFTYTLSEGATGSFFDEDVTLGNPTATAAPVLLDFLREGAAPVTRTDTVAANAPLQLRVDDVVPAGAVSTVVHSTNAVPLAVERTMSWDASGYGGHGGTALTPDYQWLFAEGSQGFFDTFLLLANDNTWPALVTVRFLLEGGGAVTHSVSVPPQSRVTLYAGDIPALVNASFGIAVSSFLPITAERAMYFPHNGARVFEGGHEAAGVNDPSRRWFLAEGATGPFFECYILLSNPASLIAHASLQYLLPSGETIAQSIDVPANGRTTINVETVDPRLANTPVSTIIDSDRAIIVERSMYWPDLSLGWREAHNSIGVVDAGLRWGVSDIRVGGARGYQTYVLLANPNAAPAEVEVRLLRSGAPPIVQTRTLPPTSRTNIFAADLSGADDVFSMEVRVLNFQPIVVEKAMYWNAGGDIWAAGTGVVATRLPPP